MSQFWRLVGGVRRYEVYTSWGVFFHVLTAILTVVSIPLVIPFFQLLFGQREGVLNPPTSFWDLEGQLHFFFGSLIADSGVDVALILICGLVVLVFALKNLSRFMISYFMVPVRNGVLRDLRSTIWKRYEMLTLTERNQHKQGYLVSLITNDLSEVDHGILKVFEMLFKTPLVVLGSLLMMIWLSPKLTLIAFVLILFTLLIVGGISHVLKRQSATAQEALSSMNSLVDEYLGSFRAIRSFNAGAYFKRLFDDQNQAYFEVTKKMLRRRDLASPLAEFLGVLTVVVLLYAGAHIVLTDQMLPSTFFAFIFAFYNIIDPAKSFAREYANVQRGIAALDRIEGFVGDQRDISERESKKEVTDFKQSLQFNQVTFGYNQEGYIINEFSLKVYRGEKIGLVGYSGQGKTTIIDLLLGFYQVDSGSILLDDVDIAKLEVASYRGLFGLVGQSPALFFGSVKDNILLGAHEDQQLLVNVMNMANLSEDSLSKRVGDRGTQLSGGEAQRITIARALYRQPEILLLDEPTSQLDNKNESDVVDAILEAMKAKTVIMITHNVSLLKSVDRIIVLQDGGIQGEGTYDQLLATNDVFRQLVV